MQLEDLDWEAGLITVRGKGKRVSQMPLPAEVAKRHRRVSLPRQTAMSQPVACSSAEKPP